MINVIEKYCKMSRKYCKRSRAKKGQILGVYQVDTSFVTIITWHVSHINAWTRLSDAARMICRLRFLYVRPRKNLYTYHVIGIGVNDGVYREPRFTWGKCFQMSHQMNRDYFYENWLDVTTGSLSIIFLFDELKSIFK